MTIQTLQKIIQIENELYQAELLEQEKILVWMQEQQASIDHNFQTRLKTLQDKKHKVHAKKIEQVSSIAEQIVKEAEEKSSRLDGLDTSVLRSSIKKSIKYILGYSHDS